ncbi:MAG: S-methyl-5'-thioinosine phosphorylase [Gammaproteobacteria bacterium]
MTVLGVIGGSGMPGITELTDVMRHNPDTPYGDTSSPILSGRLNGIELIFLARHGEQHTIAPHRVNYRANVWALHQLGAERLLAVNTVGGINRSLIIPSIAAPDQVVDYTWGRAHTFSDGPPDRVIHIDFTHPYDASFREQVVNAAKAAEVYITDGGTYGVTQGPRLESAAEINRLEVDGCDYVGMTGMPEAALARELKLKYACCAVVVNFAAGRGGAIHEQIDNNLETGMEQVNRVLKSLVNDLKAAALVAGDIGDSS